MLKKLSPQEHKILIEKGLMIGYDIEKKVPIDIGSKLYFIY